MADAFDRLVARAAPEPTRPTLAMRPRARFESPGSPEANGLTEVERERTVAPQSTDAAPRRTDVAAGGRGSASAEAPRARLDAAPDSVRGSRGMPFERSLRVPEVEAPAVPAAFGTPFSPAEGLTDASVRRDGRATPAPRASMADGDAAGLRHPSPPAPADRVVTAAELLADHIAPALVDARMLHPREAAGLVAVPRGDEGRPRRDGRTPVGLDPVEAPGSGEVHVHIDRIEISREAPVAPAAPAAAAPATRAAASPHDDYLTRQRRRWG